MKYKYRLFSVFLVLIVLFSACTTTFAPGVSLDVTPALESTAPAPSLTEGTLQVVIFDIGQADCALVKIDGHAMLIDAGNTGQDSLILGYLTKYGVDSLDFLIASHPDQDHIGSMAGVIRAMDSIGTLLMPDAVHTTKTFERLLDAIEEKSIPVTIPQPGETFEMGQVRIQVLAPNGEQYSSLNDYSIVLRVEYGETAFLFTGDAEAISENEQLQFDISADVLKVGHHGSDTSTSERYLKAVSPSYAVISCGAENSYGHPHEGTLTRLAAQGVTVYRTDENGTVIFTTNGSTITVSTNQKAPAEPSPAVIPDNTPVNTPESEAAYIGNLNSRIFHRTTCGTLPAEKNRIYFDTRDEAIQKQYRPCSYCNP